MIQIRGMCSPAFVALLTALCAIMVGPTSAHATTTLKLSNAFIEANRDRVTLDATLLVDYAHDKAKSAAEDGDIHIAGWSPEIGLITVAEIMNCKKEKTALTKANDAEGRSRAVPMTGVWRIWPEHGGDHEFTQHIGGTPVPPNHQKTTNPDHIFEVHPLTFFDGIEVRDSIGHISGYDYKDAERAFHYYENTRFHLECRINETELTMSMVGYNYTKFDIVLNEDVSHTMQDGGKAFKARIVNDEGETLVTEEWMILVPGTDAFDALKDAKEGNEFAVMGMPRVSLSLVKWRCDNASAKPYVLDWDIPYEMVILAVF